MMVKLKINLTSESNKRINSSIEINASQSISIYTIIIFIFKTDMVIIRLVLISLALSYRTIQFERGIEASVSFNTGHILER